MTWSMTVPTPSSATDAATGARGPDRLALGAFLGAVVIGGSNFVAVRYSNRELDPLWGACLRFALAAAVFGTLCAGLRLRLPRGRTLALVVAYGLLAFGLAYGALYWAMQDVSAGLAAVMMAVGPLLTLLLAVAHGLERLKAQALVGATVVIVGAALIFLRPGASEIGVGSLLLLLLAALAAAESVVVSKRCGPQHPIAMNFVGMTMGAAVLLLAAVATREQLAVPADGATQAAVGYLVAGTVGLFSLVLIVVQRWTSSSTSYVFVLMPIVAVALGALVADEEITVTTAIGGGIVCAGVYVGAVERRARGRGLRRLLGRASLRR